MSTADRQSRMRWLWPVQDGRCCHCWEPVTSPAEIAAGRWCKPGYEPSLEHVIPRSVGGSNRLENLLLAHAICNQRRGTMFLSPAAIRMYRIVQVAVQEMRERGVDTAKRSR